jgi:hypothetical protein
MVTPFPHAVFAHLQADFADRPGVKIVAALLRQLGWTDFALP